MPTITTYLDSAPNMPAASRARTGVYVKEIDCAVTPATNGDTWNILTIPAGYRIDNLMIQVLTKEGAAQTIDIGDGDNAALYFNNVDLNAGTVPVYLPGDGATGTGVSALINKFYLAAGTLSILWNNAADTCKFRVLVQMTNFTGASV